MDCRYCRRAVPMLDEQEYARARTVYLDCVEAVKRYQRTHNTALSETPLNDTPPAPT